MDSEGYSIRPYDQQMKRAASKSNICSELESSPKRTRAEEDGDRCSDLTYHLGVSTDQRLINLIKEQSDSPLMVYTCHRGLYIPFVHALTVRKIKGHYKAQAMVFVINTPFEYESEGIIQDLSIKTFHDPRNPHDSSKIGIIDPLCMTIDHIDRKGHLSLLIKIPTNSQYNLAIKKSDFSEWKECRDNTYTIKNTKIIELYFSYASHTYEACIPIISLGETRMRKTYLKATTKIPEYLKDCKRLLELKKDIQIQTKIQSPISDMQDNDRAESTPTPSPNSPEREREAEAKPSPSSFCLIRNQISGLDHQRLVPLGLYQSDWLKGSDKPFDSYVRLLKDRLVKYVPEIGAYYLSEYIDILSDTFGFVSADFESRISGDLLAGLYLLLISPYCGGLIRSASESFVSDLSEKMGLIGSKVAFVSPIWDSVSKRIRHHLFIYDQGLTVIQFSMTSDALLQICEVKVLRDDASDSQRHFQDLWSHKDLFLGQIERILSYLKYKPYVVSYL